MHVEHVDFVSVCVADVERARSLDVDTLGLRCHMAFCHDPDGNALVLHRRYAPRD